MPHATVTRSAAHPTASASATAPRETATTPREGPANHVSDFTIATAAAEAIRAAPGVVDISPGVFALVATYGAGKRLVGIVVRHLSSDQIALWCEEPSSQTSGFSGRPGSARARCRNGKSSGSVSFR